MKVKRRKIEKSTRLKKFAINAYLKRQQRSFITITHKRFFRFCFYFFAGVIESSITSSSQLIHN